MAIAPTQIDLAHHILASLVAIAAVWPLRARLVARAEANPNASASEKRTRSARIRLVATAALAVILAMIWYAEIQSFLWSLTAVAAALVLATKELIQCGTGALFRAAGRSLSVGDRIEIDGIYGEIVQHGLLTTTLAERERRSVGGHLSGRTVVLPNSRLLSAEVRVERQGTAFVTHRFHMIFEPSVSTHAAVAKVDAIAQRHASQIAPPAVSLSTTEMAKIRLDISIQCAPERAAELEREVKMEFLEWLWAEAQARQAAPLSEQISRNEALPRRAA